jgi:hypothetical protein
MGATEARTTQRVKAEGEAIIESSQRIDTRSPDYEAKHSFLTVIYRY